MKRYLALALTFASIGVWALTHAHEVRAQSRNGVSGAWSGVYKNSSPSDRRFDEIRALEEHTLRKGGIVGGGGGTIVNGDMIQHYHGPVSNSSVTNAGNINSTSTSVTASGGSAVIVDNINGQTANNANQSGAANSNAAQGDNATQSGSANNQ